MLPAPATPAEMIRLSIRASFLMAEMQVMLGLRAMQMMAMWRVFPANPVPAAAPAPKRRAAPRKS